MVNEKISLFNLNSNSNYNPQHTKINFAPGDKVLVINHPRKSKLDPIYLGPYTVVQSDMKTNRIQVEDNKTITWESIRNVKHFHVEE